MKIILLIIFVLSIIQVINCQQIEYIYINSKDGNDDSGDGSISKPYQTICKLNQILNNNNNTQPPIPQQSIIIINIAYGEYYNSNQPCIIEIINLNNISIIPYNSNNNNNNNDKEVVLIKYINFNITNSNLIIENININVGNEEIKSNVLNVGLIIFDSSVLLNNVLFNLSSYDYYQKKSYINMIMNSNFIMINQSQLIFNLFDRDITIDESNFKSSNSTVIYSSFISISHHTITIDDNSKFIDCLFNLNNGKVTITNSILYITSHNNDNGNFYIDNSTITIMNCSIESIVQTILSEPIIYVGTDSNIIMENVLISGFKNLGMLFSFRSGLVEINQISFINCQFSTLISIFDSLETLPQYYTTNISIDGLNLIDNNKYSKFIDISSTSLNISISNIITTKCNSEYNVPSFITINNKDYDSKIKNLISITNLGLECFGSSLFKNSIVKFENITFNRIIFTNNLITLSDNTEFSLVSSSLYSIYAMVENNGHFISLNSNSSILVSNCTLSQFSTSFINANDYSIVSIVDSMILNSKSNFNPFINIDKSDLYLSNIIIDQYYTLNAPLINLGNNSTCLMYLFSISQSWFDFGYIYYSTDSHTTISKMNINECFSQLSLFHQVGNYLEITNSTFTNNNNMVSSAIMFKLDRVIEIKMINCTFYSNSFSPFIDSFNSNNASYDGITFQKNSGSFYTGSSDTGIIFSNFQMVNNDKIPLEYLISLVDTLDATFSNLYLVNNYFSKYLIHSIQQTGNLIINEFQYINNTITDNLNYLVQTTPFQKNGPIAQFLIESNQGCIISNFIGIGNTFSSNLFYILNGFITIENSTVSNNKLQFQSKLVESIESDLNIINSQFNENIEIYSNTIKNNDDKGLIYQYNGNLLIDGCIMNGNYFKMSKGCILNINTINGEKSKYFIYNSKFNNNIGNFGGVIYIDSDYRKSNFQLLNNSFTNNYGKGGGGAIYTTNFALSNNYGDDDKPLIDNKFINNTCCMNKIGNNFSSLLNTAISNTRTPLYHESQLIEYSFIDYYNQIVLDIYGELPITITCDNSSVHSFNDSTSLIIGGQGSFKWENENNCTELMLVQIMVNQIQYPLLFDINGCPKYKYYITNQCEYCPIGWTLPLNSKNEKDCYYCDTEKQSCIESSVYALKGYYLDDKPIECAIDMCNEGNQCISNYYYGILCYNCVDSNSNNVATKNGIQCCNQFKPFLIIPIIIIFVIASLLLSIGKYSLLSNQYSYIVPIIIFFQMNSVVFFSYSGIYLLPLFRLSIDMLDGYCLWSSLNYNYKSLIIYTIIMWSFLISYSDITLMIINRYYYPIIKKILPNSSLSIKSKFIKRLNIKITCNNDVGHLFKMKSIWVLFQLYLIPLLFNSISLITIKKDLDIYYLIVDFSIVYLKDDITKFTFSISIIILLLVSVIIVFLKFKNIIYNSNYNNNSKLRYNWDYIIMIKSYLFISLSLSMIFSSTFYLVIILAVQIIYTISHFLINPFKKQFSNLYKVNNLINLLQLILFVLSGTTLFQLIDPPHYKGIIITCYSFSSVIIVLFFKSFFNLN